MGCKEARQSYAKKWYKGNLHTHSYWSDGDEFPEVIMEWYKKNDYQFIALSDHNILAEGDYWIEIPNDSIYQRAFKSYLEKYGTDWVDFKIDSLNNKIVKLTAYKDYKELFEEDETFLIIQSEEITDHFDNKPIHMNATNIQKKIEPQSGTSVLNVINHPNFAYSISLEDMIALRNERFFEVYNGHPQVHNSGDSIHMSTERMWDLINISYIKNNKPLMYGIASDDSHHYHRKASKWSNAGRGWIMVRADSLNPKALIEAMEQGDFYASTGVELKEVVFENNMLNVEVMEESDVTYNLSFIGCKEGNTEPELLQSVIGNKASFKLEDDILFIRCKITSSKLQDNPIEDILYESAWTQPFMVAENK
ncbi:MAG: histidinol-phosphatase [Flavobacteriaceae bacterium]